MKFFNVAIAVLAVSAAVLLAQDRQWLGMVWALACATSRIEIASLQRHDP